MSKRVLLLGASGTIGRATALALDQAGHQVTCNLRAEAVSDGLESFELRFGKLNISPGEFDAVISCIASRSGTPSDAWAVDYRVQSDALKQAQSAGVPQFVLLSAICVQKPTLAFQKAKLAFEAELQRSGVVWSIVRPTAFFKSLSGQLNRLRRGKPFLVFGDGEITACKPISDRDLGQYLCLCLTEQDMQNKILPIGGPGPALTPLEQGRMLCEAVGVEAKFKHVPVNTMNWVIHILSAAGKFNSTLAEKAELARIGRYYGTESMLVWDGTRYDADATPEFGSDTLKAHYQQIANGVAADDRGRHAVF